MQSVEREVAAPHQNQLRNSQAEEEHVGAVKHEPVFGSEHHIAQDAFSHESDVSDCFEVAATEDHLPSETQLKNRLKQSNATLTGKKGRIAF